LISSSSKTCGYNDISRLLDEFFVDMTAVMIPTIPAFTKIISDTLNIHVSYPFGGSNQDHCEVDAKYEEKIRREIFSIPSFFLLGTLTIEMNWLEQKRRLFIFSSADGKIYICS
jgi:hypothetical protein